MALNPPVTLSPASVIEERLRERLENGVLSRRAFIDDLVEELRYGGDGSLWRQTVLVWAKSKRDTMVVPTLVVALYWLGRYIPVPGVSASLVAELRRAADPGTLALWDFVTGGNPSRPAVFAFGIVPYIIGSMLVHLAITLWKAFIRRTSSPQAMRIVKATRITAFVICAMWSRGFARLVARSGASVFSDSSHWLFQLAAMVTLVAGMALLVWASELADNVEDGVALQILFRSRRP